MKNLLPLSLALLPLPALAEGFERPIPLPQTAAAEVTFLIASIVMILMLGAVHYLVNRR
ncbi:hypothetical protein RSK20926_03714 [Roseobacter sp. SK209-2-6]|uniref:hypothetical protein n=1 Tax=Roseobacter sp. SK209-2-6 TaxID=388739 RepID=UPI0000F3ED78|nr:hypothetical protein [Roseobacter sp. SK209-2-6]EBA16881.1 hypothetical protein RSK20926_03714 [Roseobacter sp. SK209-2-6]